MLKIATTYIEAIFKSADSDGWFGPAYLKTVKKTENGEDIREEHHIRVERHGEDGWDAIESEHKIAKFYEQHRNEQWGYKPLAATRLIGFHNLVVGSFLGAYKEFAAEEIMRYATEL